MPDQATTLRSLAAAASQIETINIKPLINGVGMKEDSTRTRTIAITSGKGGVGKSNIAVNLALELAVRGHRVSLFDADCALANTDVLLGLNPHYHLGHVLAGQRTLEQVVIEAAHGLRLIPGGSGTEELANLSQEQHTRLVSDLQALERDSDFMIIDTAAGIASNVTGVLRAAMEVIIVTTPDPTAVVDAYATIKVLLQHSPSKPIKVIVNDVVGINDADRVFAQLRAVTTRFLNHQIEHLGMVPRDPELADAVREQMPVLEYAPDAPSSRALRLIARRLEKTQRGPLGAEKLANSFWCSLNGADV